ncbi:hypothetical protein DFJ73DRAFT_69800 [Zopfochytrium polystomum]|nr:hypothetical protein DFJ73DRAFT_69800 [Zopfochytrium polystomum]
MSEDGAAGTPQLVRGMDAPIVLDFRANITRFCRADLPSDSVKRQSMFGLAHLTHIGGAPTSLAIEIASYIHRRRQRSIGDNALLTNRSRFKQFTVIPASQLYNHKLAKKCIELLAGSLQMDGYLVPLERSMIDWEVITFAQCLGMETRITVGYPSPLRWIDQSAQHLKNIFGKSSGEGDKTIEMLPPLGLDDLSAAMRDDELEEGAAPEAEIAHNTLETFTGSFPSVRRHATDLPTPRLSGPQILGASAIAVQLLQSKRSKDCLFDWRRILDRHKDLGLYLQYAHARLCGIELKSGIAVNFNANLTLLERSAPAIALVSTLAQQQIVLSTVCRSFEPSTFLPQLVALARIISSGHNSMFVRGSPDELAGARMLLLWCSRIVLASGLRLLGLHPIERM